MDEKQEHPQGVCNEGMRYIMCLFEDLNEEMLAGNSLVKINSGPTLKPLHMLDQRKILGAARQA